MGEKRLRAFQFFHHGTIDEHARVFTARRRPGLQHDDDSRAHHEDDGDGRSHSRALADLARELLVGHGGEDTIVAPDDRWRAEVRQRHHKDDEGSSGEGRQHQRKRYREESLHRSRPQIFRRFLEGAVDGHQRSGEHQGYKRIILQRIGENDAYRPVDRRQLDADGHEEIPEKTIVAQHRDPRIGADEGRRQECQHRQSRQRIRAANPVSGREKPEGNAE